MADPTLGMLWSAASGVGVLALGVVCARGGDERSPGSLAFGLFAVAWAVQILAINAGAVVAEASLAARIFLLCAGAGVLMPFLLVEFAAAYDPDGARGPLWSSTRFAAGGFALLGAAALALEPALLVEGAREVSGHFFPAWGPLEVPLIGLSRLAAFGIALAVLYRAVRHAPTARTKARVAFLLGGLGLFLSYSAGNNLAAFSSMAVGISSLTDLAYTVGFALLSLLVLGMGGHALYASRGEPTDEARRRETLLGAALLAPWILGVLEYAVAAPLLPELRTVGLWRLAGVAVIAYGLARWRVYDLPERVRLTTSSATGAAGALAGGATAYGVAAGVVGGLVVPLVGALAVTGATIAPSVHLAQRWLGPNQPDNPIERDRQRFEQRVEAYRSALEASMARDTLDQDEPFLEALRERFEIGDEQDRVLRYYARQAVVPTRSGDPDDAYERLRVLGEGGAGRTWLARDRARERLVVLKEPLDRWQSEPDVLEAARREAELAAKVDHPNVVDVEEVVEDDGVPVLVMEHVAGGSLADRLREHGTLDWRRAVAVAHDVAQGLTAVHREAIVHRDVKPANVLVDDDGSAKVTDFGVARRTEDGDTRLVGGPEPPGTEPYMAPEERTGAASGDERVDVYACTALLYACLAGTPPSPGQAVDLEGVPEALQAVLERGLAPSPEDRYPSAPALADALAEVART